LVEYELILRLWLTQPAFVRGRHGFADPMTLEQLVAEYAQSAQCSRHVRLPPGLEERRRCGEDVACAAEYVEPLVPDRDIQLADHAGQILDGAQCLGEHGDVVETRGTEQSTLSAQHGAERLAVHRVVGQCGDAAVQLGGDRSDLVCRVLEERACLLRPRLVHLRPLGADANLIPACDERVGPPGCIVASRDRAHILDARTQSIAGCRIERERPVTERARSVLEHARRPVRILLPRDLRSATDRPRGAMQLLRIGRLCFERRLEAPEVVAHFGDEEVVQGRHQPSPLRAIPFRAARMISAMSRTARSMPVKNARLITLWPMLSSSMSLTAATRATFS